MNSINLANIETPAFQTGLWYPAPDSDFDLVRNTTEPIDLVLALGCAVEKLDHSQSIKDYPKATPPFVEVSFLPNVGSWSRLGDFDLACTGIMRANKKDYVTKGLFLDGPGAFMRLILPEEIA